MLADPPEYAKPKESRSQPPPQDDQQENSDINDILNKDGPQGHYGSKERQSATASKHKPGSKKISAVHVDSLSYQDMTPEQQAAHDKLMQPRRYTNTVDDLPRMKATGQQQPQSSGFADFFGFGGQQPQRKLSDDEMDADVHRQQKADKGGNNSDPLIRSENGDEDKEY